MSFLRISRPLLLACLLAIVSVTGAQPSIANPPQTTSTKMVIRDHRQTSGNAGNAGKSGTLTLARPLAVDVRFPGAGKPSQKLAVPQKDLQRLRSKYKTEPKVVALNSMVRGTMQRSLVTQVNEHPQGFGATFTWDRATDEALLVVFVNAADDLGIAISGMQRGDRIQVLSIAGICSFSDGNGKLLASLVGLADAGAKVAAGAYAPELIPVINEASKFAKEQLKASSKGKRRDGFGADSGEYRRQEGGILVTLPESSGPYYSGGFFSKDRWIQRHIVGYSNTPFGQKIPIFSDKLGRTDEVRPKHVRYGFYPIRHLQPHENARHNTRTLTSTGTVYVLPWDHDWDDNTGHYKVELRLVRGSNSPPVVD